MVVASARSSPSPKSLRRRAGDRSLRSARALMAQRRPEPPEPSPPSHIPAHQGEALSSGGMPYAAVPGSVSRARTGGVVAGLPSWGAVLAAGAGAGVSLAEAT